MLPLNGARDMSMNQLLALTQVSGVQTEVTIMECAQFQRPHLSPATFFCSHMYTYVNHFKVTT